MIKANYLTAFFNQSTFDFSGWTAKPESYKLDSTKVCKNIVFWNIKGAVNLSNNFYLGDFVHHKVYISMLILTTNFINQTLDLYIDNQASLINIGQNNPIHNLCYNNNSEYEGEFKKEVYNSQRNLLLEIKYNKANMLEPELVSSSYAIRNLTIGILAYCQRNSDVSADGESCICREGFYRKNRNFADNICKEKKGYGRNFNFECSSCGRFCIKCTALETCQVCAANFELLNGVCILKDGMFL